MTLATDMNRVPLRSSGLTLIEVLVVLGIIAILLGLILPALGKAREAAASLECKTRLSRLQQGWLSQVIDHPKIPYTRNPHYHPNWIDVLDKAFPDAPDIRGQETLSAAICPQVGQDYGEISYFGIRWGYAVNTLWRRNGELNEGKFWEQINQPSRYPWFVDPSIYPWSHLHTAARHVPSDIFGGYWGVGANHDSGKMANIAYADGSVRGTYVQVPPDEHDNLSFFANE